MTLRCRTAWPVGLGLALASQWLGGCRHDDDGGAAQGESTGSDDGADSTTGDPAAPSYWQDAAPILFEHCGQCHRDGGIAPFVIDDYAQAAAWAEASAMAVSERTMPPWLVTDDGSCGEFRDSRALSQADIDTLVAWAAAGAPEGTPRDDLQQTAPPSLAQAIDLDTPAFVPVAEGTPWAEADEYRCFVVDAGADVDRVITAYEVVPGNDALTHHVLLFDLDPTLEVGPGQTNADVIAALDAESPDRDGWPCFGASGDGTAPSGVPVAWAPGQGVMRFPDGVGYPLASGTMLVAQVHYNLAAADDEVEPFTTRVRLQTRDTVERPLVANLIDPFLGTLASPTPASLAPGEAAVQYSWQASVAELAGPVAGLDVYGVLPHMHARGVSQRFDVVHADGSRTCGLDVPRWDIAWQLFYFFQQPLRLQPDDVVEVTCTYDTRDASEPVMPGWGSSSEMCLLGVYAAPVLP